MPPGVKKVKTVTEPAKTIPVYDEVDVLVVGSGPAGHSAAMAAARAGVKRVGLMERFNHLGGMPTGGHVVYLPALGYDPDPWRIWGIEKEWIDRLKVHDQCLLQAPEEEIGSTDPAIGHKWKSYFGFMFGPQLSNSTDVDPDMLKVVLDEMIEGEGGKITCYMQCWAVGAIVEDRTIKGVIFESKEGRKAILAKVVIDCTGDGDIGAFAGCGYDDTWDSRIRSSHLASCFRLGGVDFRKYAEYKANLSPKEVADNNAKFHKFASAYGPNACARNDQAWINTLADGSCLKIKDLTNHDRDMRLHMTQYLELVRQFPGMENAYLLDLAPQTGTRGGRRIFCEYTITEAEYDIPILHKDVVMVSSHYTTRTDVNVYFPYRVMVPLQVENLLISGRAYSSTARANDSANVIPHCIILGQAAGIAAAVAIEDGVNTRNINIGKLHEGMRAQDMYVPTKF